jgi:hypothetical protein
MRRTLPLLAIVAAALFIGSAYPDAREAGSEGSKTDLIFGCFVGHPQAEGQAALLAESLRTFGGKYKDAPIWVFHPSGRAPEKRHATRLREFRAEMIPCTIPPEAARFPFAGKPYASAAAEAAAEGKAKILVWMDTHSLVLKEPDALLLGPGKSFGYRAVDHKLIGSRFKEPPDEFWSHLYKRFSLNPASVLKVETPVDREVIRAYFNAGLLVVRPERGLLRKWRAAFETLHRDPAVVKMCRESQLRAIFLHQAALAVAVLKHAAEEELTELPRTVNYPLHMQDQFRPEDRLKSIAALETLRYDTFFDKPDWRSAMPGPEDLASWIATRAAPED